MTVRLPLSSDSSTSSQYSTTVSHSEHDDDWLCIFCSQPPHTHGLGDLFGPYSAGSKDVWMHVDCVIWVPCVILGPSGQVEGIQEAVDQTKKLVCILCNTLGSSVGCTQHGCRHTAHVHCARKHGWSMDEGMFDAKCVIHVERRNNA